MNALENGFAVPSTAKNTLISPNFLVGEFCGKEQFSQTMRKLSFPQNFHTNKLGEIKVFFPVPRYIRIKNKEKAKVEKVPNLGRELHKILQCKSLR